jgi:hypothetical protein
VKTISLALLAAAVLTGPAAAGPDIHVMKTSGCGCCVKWMAHLEDHGFDTTAEDLLNAPLVQRKMALGIPPAMASCHTATVEGHVIEGHVPAADILRLLSERPAAVGLSVPAMPIGSPGMEFGDRVEAYDVHLIRADGTTEVFSSYPAE